MYMSKVTKFDKATLRALRADLQKVLAQYGSNANIDFSIGNIKFSSAECDIKIKAKIVGAVTLTDTLLAAQIKRLGLVTTNKQGDTLVEYRARNRAYPFIYRTAAGKQYKTSELSVKLRFKA
jgi:hypothetical protein